MSKAKKHQKDSKKRQKKETEFVRAAVTVEEPDLTVTDTADAPSEETPEESEFISAEYAYVDIIRDFPEMADYLGHLALSTKVTCIDLLGLAQSLQVRIDYSSKLEVGFSLYPQKEVLGHGRRAVAATLVVTDQQVTFPEQAWLIGKGLATYILNVAEYVPDFSENEAAMTKWNVDKLASELLLPEDLVVRATELAEKLNAALLDTVDAHNRHLSFNTPHLSIVDKTAARLANVPEWLMRQRINDVYNF
ncbi:hypothetical protein [Loigolactobacillus binensis]|uniref:Uncharacterized protein n=1 Tax=Loigolactobacillus binensis TaxID=2559922 RepID=A0ABW3EG59_9LACO|nr:hypothetical protein [Loigolactobacillus binensis]